MTEPVFRGSAIFCDDIRREEGNKLTFVGVYTGDMIINGDFPFLIPKFGLVINYMELREASVTDDVIIRMFLPGEDENGPPSLEGVLAAQEARRTVQPHPDADAAAPRYLSLTTNLLFSPLLIAQKGTMRVRAYIGKEVLKLGSLLITKAANEAPTA